ncbi:MAG: class I SAM-dependent methyltransferase [Phycisphaerae bacterium]|nr:class I SAM-dependent methyltransferase [Phycisphaerae bacterium]
MGSSEASRAMAGEIFEFYDRGKELGRLTRGIGPLELARTQELVTRYLPAPPAVVYDVGGGPGVYSFWLAGLGYDVHLVDVAPLHIEEAGRTAGDAGSPRLAGMQVGDARDLPFTDGSADAVVLHGPLYHLTEREDRLAALREARRVLRRGGVLLAFAVTPYASTIVGLVRGWVWDADYLEMMGEEIGTGQHRRPATWPDLFARSFFHHPDLLAAEITDAGFRHEGTLGVQGPAWMVPDFAESWADERRREVILRVARMSEGDPVLGPHMMAVARKEDVEAPGFGRA